MRLAHAAIVTAPLLLATGAVTAQTDAQLRYVCKDFVERRLHDPGSAKLDWTAGRVARRAGNISTVRFPGRAKNAYGALVLSTFECVIQYQGNDRFTPVTVRVYE